jgi:hypothetical protein
LGGTLQVIRSYWLELSAGGARIAKLSIVNIIITKNSGADQNASRGVVLKAGERAEMAFSVFKLAGNKAESYQLVANGPN